MAGSIERLERELKIDVKWRCFPLHPETPLEGVSLARLFGQPEAKIETWMEDMRQTAAGLGLPFGIRRKTFNSCLSQEVGLWAEERGKGDAFKMALFKTYFVDEQNIALKDVLLKLVEYIGLSPTEADEVIERRAFKAEVDKDWALAKSMGITAVPTLVVGDRKLVGFKPYKQILDFVQKSAHETRTANRKLNITETNA